MPVTKAYHDRDTKMVSFGIGQSFDDLKTNSAITTVQRENVWMPFYETIIDEMDFKEKMMAAAEEKRLANIGGSTLGDLQKKLREHDETVKLVDQDKKREELGLAPKRTFNIKEKMMALKAKEEEKGEQKFIDPVTIKIRKLPSQVTEDELRSMMIVHGRITRVKIPMDESGYSKQIGFVTFESEGVAAALVAEGSIKYDFYELPLEAAYFSAQMQQRRIEDKERAERRAQRGEDGDFRGGRGGFRGRDGEGGFRGGRGGRDGGYGDRREGGGYERREGGYGGGERREGGYERRGGRGEDSDFIIKRNN